MGCESTTNPRDSKSKLLATFWSDCDNRVATILCAALAMGGFCRFYRLGGLTLNHDEPFTTYITTQATWLQIATSTVPTERGTPPLYFILLKLWCEFFGDTEWVLRFPSAVLGTAAILVIFAIGRELYSAEVGAVAAGLLALNPMHMDCSRDARFYPLFVFLVLINGWLFLRLMRRNSGADAILYAVSFALLLYSHLYGGFFLVAQVCYSVREWLRKRNVNSFILGVVLGLVLVAPYGYVLMLDFRGRLNEQLGYTKGISYLAPLMLYRQILGSSICPVILMLGGYALAERSESDYVLLSWATIPVVIAFLVSCLYPNRLILTQRYLVTVLPAILVLAARGLQRLSTARGAFAIICVYSLIVGALSFGRILRYKTTDWRTIASTVSQKASGGSVAINTGSLQVLKYYLRRSRVELVGLDCSGEPSHHVPSPPTLLYIQTSESRCDASTLRGMLVRYGKMEQTRLDEKITLINFSEARK